VGDDDGAAREILERFLDRPDRVDVEVVRGLVEQDEVGARLEEARQVHPVALAAGENADLLLLVGPGEPELGAVGARVHLAPPILRISSPPLIAS
jgi:hypothetical protein